MARKPRVVRANLDQYGFMRMHDDRKTMEYRLRRGKWQTLRAGDIIEFHNDAITGLVLRVKVLWIVNYPDFPALLRDFDPWHHNHRKKTCQLQSLRHYYSRQEARQHTVLGIKVKKMKVLATGRLLK